MRGHCEENEKKTMQWIDHEFLSLKFPVQNCSLAMIEGRTFLKMTDGTVQATFVIIMLMGHKNKHLFSRNRVCDSILNSDLPQKHIAPSSTK